MRRNDQQDNIRRDTTQGQETISDEPRRDEARKTRDEAREDKTERREEKTEQ